jgi:hypothetical protein
MTWLKWSGANGSWPAGWLESACSRSQGEDQPVPRAVYLAGDDRMAFRGRFNHLRVRSFALARRQAANRLPAFSRTSPTRPPMMCRVSFPGFGANRTPATAPANTPANKPAANLPFVLMVTPLRLFVAEWRPSHLCLTSRRPKRSPGTLYPPAAVLVLSHSDNHSRSGNRVRSRAMAPVGAALGMVKYRLGGCIFRVFQPQTGTFSPSPEMSECPSSRPCGGDPRRVQ